MTPARAADRLDRFAGDLGSAAVAGLEHAAALAKDRAIWWSEGPFGAAQQRRMYNPHGPYSKADPHPPDDEARINVQQQGGLAAQWVKDVVKMQAGSATVAVFNTSREAQFMGHWEGDRWVQGDRSAMIARPLPVRVMDEIEERVREMLGEALSLMMGA